MQPIILLASERSGSNLLRVILGSHSRISAPPPAHLLKHLAPLRHLYVNGNGGAQAEKMVDDALALTYIGYAWDEKINNEDILKRLKPSPTLWDVFRQINEAYAERKGCDYWFTKDTYLFNYSYQLKLHFKDIKFIFLSRDGRDVASSAIKSPGHEKHIYTLARKWQEEQVSSIQFMREAKNKDIIHIRYEDILQDTENTIRKVTKFLKIPFEEGMLKYYETDATKTDSKRAGDWNNLSKPIISENFNKYRKILTTNQTRLFEKVAGRELEMLGYKRDYPNEPVLGKVSLPAELWYKTLGTFIQKRGQIKLAVKEPKRLKRLRLLRDIKARLYKNA